jgi:hypothetical protein
MPQITPHTIPMEPTGQADEYKFIFVFGACPDVYRDVFVVKGYFYDS